MRRVDFRVRGQRPIVRSVLAPLTWLALVFAVATSCSREQPAPPRRGPLKVALRGQPTTLDPHLQNEVRTHTVLFNVYEALTAFDADMRLVPGLALRWESLDDLTWRLSLRPSVRFHDGRALRPEDVVASLDRARRHPRSRTAPYVLAVREARVAGAGAVEIVTHRPYAILLNKLAFVAIVPADSPEEITMPVGTGPYRFGGRRAGEAVELEAFDAYWGGRPSIPRVSLIEVDLAERGRRIRDGQLDLVLALGAAEREAVQSARPPRLRLVSRASLSVTYLGMRCDRPPFSDRRVRRAVSAALDRRRLVDQMELGEPLGQMVGPEIFGHDPGLPVPAPDPALARRLLAESGHPGGFAVELDAAERVPIGPLVEQLAAVGIRATPRPGPWEEVVERLRAGRFALYLGSVLCPTGDASDLLDGNLHAPEPARGYGSGNYTRYSNRALDALIEESGAVVSMEARLPVLQRSLRLLAQELPLVPVSATVNWHAVRAGIGWRPRVDGFFRAHEVSEAGR